MNDPLGKYKGNDNYGKPKSAYLERLKAMTDKELEDETKSKIWLSAYANNNPRSDYHWHADATYDEWQRRGNETAYSEQWEKVRASI